MTDTGATSAPDPAAVAMNAGRPVAWSADVAPGGYVCAEPDDLTADGICGNPVESEPCNRHGDDEPPATVTPGQADTLTISESTTERDQLAAKLAHALAANQRWAETLADVQQRHAEVKRERDDARGVVREMLQWFGEARYPGPASTTSAHLGRISAWRRQAGLEADGA